MAAFKFAKYARASQELADVPSMSERTLNAIREVKLELALVFVQQGQELCKYANRRFARVSTRCAACMHTDFGRNIGDGSGWMRFSMHYDGQVTRSLQARQRFTSVMS